MELRSRAARSNSEHLTDFFVREALDVVEHKHPAGARRKELDRRLEIDRQSGADITERSRIHHIVKVFNFFHAVHAATLRLPFVEHHIHRESMQPRSKGALPAKLAELVPHAHEDILGQLFGARAVVDHARADGKHPIHVRSVEPLEGAAIPGRCQGDLGVLSVEHFRIRFRAPDWHLHSLTVPGYRWFEFLPLSLASRSPGSSPIDDSQYVGFAGTS